MEEQSLVVLSPPKQLEAKINEYQVLIKGQVMKDVGINKLSLYCCPSLLSRESSGVGLGKWKPDRAQMPT